MNVVNQYVEKRNGFTELVAFCHVTCRYFDRFLLQGVDRNWRKACLFSLAPVSEDNVSGGHVFVKNYVRGTYFPRKFCPTGQDIPILG